MTQAEKAQAYDEMVQRVKELHEAGNALTKKQMEIICPELAESEDERIRKEIIHYILYKAKDVSEEQEHAWIAYLEMQKEQKSSQTEQPYSGLICAETLNKAKENKYIKVQLLWELMHNGIITEVDYMYLTDDKRKPWTAEEYRIAYQKGFDMSEQLKQKDQNPVEIHIDNPNIQKFNPNVKITTSDSSAGRAVNIESDKAGLKDAEQKPVEKQDYSGLNELERVIHRGFLCAGVENVPVGIIKETAQECLTQMQSAEWSEEEKDKVVRYLHDKDGGMLWSKATEITKDILDMLRPSWKPSEEQMRVFLKATPVNLMPEELSIYKSLCNDIQKLM